MSRGSISSWQDYGRRNSQHVPQFSGNPVEFMTYEGIEGKRGDGWFLSYTKIAAIIVVFIIGVVAAGFLGWYINSLPPKKSYDSVALRSDEIEDNDIVGDSSVSSSIHPLKYHLDLTPIIDVNGTSWLKGKVIIEFRVGDMSSLRKLSLNAKNISVTSYNLLGRELGAARTKRDQRRKAEDDAIHQNHEVGASSFSGSKITNTVYSMSGDSSTISLTKNETTLYKKIMERSTENVSFMDVSKASLMRDDSDLGNDEIIINGTNTWVIDEINMNGTNSSATEESTESAPKIESTNSEEIAIVQYDIDEDKGVHVIYFSPRIKQGTYSLEIEYEITLDGSAFYVANFSASDEEKWLMGTSLKPLSVRHLFPVFDDLRLKSVFSVSVTHSKETIVLSNMPINTTREIVNNSMIIDYFDETPPLSAQNLDFLMGHIEPIAEMLIRDSKVKATFWGVSKRHSQGIYLLDKLDSAVINLIDMFSIPYPLAKLDLVGLPPGIDENTGSLGLISMKQSLFYTKNYSSLVTKNDALMALVNLLGHQWLGGLVNVNWTDAWILEGTLLYLQHDIVKKIDSSLDSSDSFLNDIQSDAMQIDGYSISRPLQADINHLRLHTLHDQYAKGACLIRMLHGAISDSAFRNGYRKFTAKWKFGATDIAEFFSIMNEEAIGLPETVEKVMNSWISQSGYPVVTVTRNYEEGSVIIHQEQFTYDKPLDKPTKLWFIPLNYVSDNESWSAPTMTWFQSETEMTLKSVGTNDSWVLFNVNKTGYYRVHYDYENWMHLKIALEENHEAFPPETRASLIDDIFSLAAVGLIKYETVFDFIKYMQINDRHHAPWGALMRHVFKLNRLLYETSAFTDFQEFMLKFISPLYSEVGSEIEKGSKLTLIVIRMGCVFEHAECYNWARKAFEKTDTKIEDLIPLYLRTTFYCTIARYGARKEWNYFIEEARSAIGEEKRSLLSSFACFQPPWILQSILNEILHEETFQEEDISVILRAFPKNPAAAQTAYRFVRANWHDVVRRFSGSHSVLRSFIVSMVNGLTTEQDLEDLQAFRENNYGNMEGVRYAAAAVEANANFVTWWLINSFPEVESLLRKKQANEESV